MGYWCEKCGEVALSPFPYPLDGRKHEHAQLACTGRVIPIATICDPPEPTVIEASDLAPGMVGKIDDADGEWLVTMDVHVDDVGFAWSLRMDSICDPGGVQYVAGRGRPCCPAFCAGWASPTTSRT